MNLIIFVQRLITKVLTTSSFLFNFFPYLPFSQILHKKAYGRPVDVYSLAKTLLEMILVRTTILINFCSLRIGMFLKILLTTFDLSVVI
jgi:hypothetical protein